MTDILTRRKALLAGFGGLAACAAPVGVEVTGSTSQALTLTGADPTGATSSHEAFSCALEWLRDHGGGALYVPRGRYTFCEPCTMIDLTGLAGGIRMAGDGAGTEIRPVGMSGQTLFQFHNATDRISFENLSFLGNSDTTSEVDIGTLLYGSYCHGGFEFTRCAFGGVRASAHLIMTNLADLVVRDSHFNGSAAGSAVIRAYEWKNVLVENVTALDYHSCNGEGHSKTGGGNSSWLWIDKPNGQPSTQNASNQGSVVVRGCRFDEGAAPQIRIESVEGGRIGRVCIEDTNINVSPAAGGVGVYAKGVDRLRIARVHASWGTARHAIDLVDCDVAELEHVYASGTIIRADEATAYLHLQDCTYSTLDSSAVVTRVTTKGVTT